MKLILPEQITEAQYKAYLADLGAERIVPIASANAAGATPKCSLRSRCLSHMPWVCRRRLSPAQTILKERSEKHDKF